VTNALAVVLRHLAALNAPIARWGLSFSAVLLALMLAVALAQIASRGLFNHTLDWAEEIARWALVWGALLAAPMGYRGAGHVAITLLVEALPPRLLYAVAIGINLLIGWICLMLFIEGLAFVGRGATLVATALPVGMGWVYAIVPISLAALLLVSVEAVLRLLLDLSTDVAGREPLVGVVPLLDRDPQD
jgi:TRAP-type C4-dicarboxylate transport system permease small subunit